VFKRYIHAADAVFSLVLFCVFALSMLLVLMSGVGAYKDIRSASENGYSENTCISYVSTKVHHNLTADSIYLSEVAGEPAIALEEEINGEIFVTYIYYFNGYVKELFTMKGNDFPAESGFDVLQVSAFTFDISTDGLLHVSCTGTGGSTAQTYLNLYTGGMTA